MIWLYLFRSDLIWYLAAADALCAGADPIPPPESDGGAPAGPGRRRPQSARSRRPQSAGSRRGGDGASAMAASAAGTSLCGGPAADVLPPPSLVASAGPTASWHSLMAEARPRSAQAQAQAHGPATSRADRPATVSGVHAMES
jgi:hypothetical protein